jgi:outer membrane protein assembly factor BamB
VLQRDVPVGGRGRKDGPIESFVLALDSVTGRELWRQVRPSEARQESREAFSSPVPLLGTARPEILVVGGDCLTGHDPATGRELWRWGTWNPTRITHWRLVPSPVSGAGYVLACTPKGGPVYGIRTGAEGTLAETGYSWKTEDRDVSADVPTPLFYEGRFYVLNGNRHTLSAIDPASGKTLWTGALDSSAVFEASPTAADGRIFAINHRGELFVVAAGDTFKLLDKIQFGTDQDRRVRASVALAGNRAFVRTDARLFCFGDSR